VQGLIQSAFLWGYTATQLLGGSLADKYGGRAVIAAGEQLQPLVQESKRHHNRSAHLLPDTELAGT